MVKKYIDENKKRPSTVDNEKNIQQLGNWVSNQLIRANKKKSDLHDKEQVLKWKKFMKQYNIYFDKILQENLVKELLVR